MRHWLALAGRTWRTRWGRSLMATTAIALGVAVVVWVTCCYASMQSSLTEWVHHWIGRSHVNIESAGGRWGQISTQVLHRVESLDIVERATARLWYQMLVAPARPRPDQRYLWTVDAMGILPDREWAVRSLDLRAGRLLEPDDARGMMMEADFADQLGLTVGEEVAIYHYTHHDRRKTFTIVGLVERHRISRFHPPMVWLPLSQVQALNRKPGVITDVDVILRDGSLAGIRAAQPIIEQAAAGTGDVVKVTTSEVRQRNLEFAQRETAFVMLLLSCIALFTAFFIILSTLSMGMVERIRQMGLMRCIGLTRWQLGALATAEVLPLGVVGVAAGLPLGWLLTLATVQIVPEYVGRAVLNVPGLWLAAGGGMLTTLLGSALPTLRAMTTSPLAAVRASGRRVSGALDLAAAGAGLAMIAAHYVMVHELPIVWWIRRLPAFTGLLLLYAGYALAAPLLVRTLGAPAVRIAAGALHVRRQLLADQVGRAAWRGAGICCGLMVGLSVIVAMVVKYESMLAGWQFPKQFPEAAIYTYEHQPPARLARLTDVPGVRQLAVAGEFRCEVDQQFIIPWLKQSLRVIATDARSLETMIKLDYLEGTEADALARFRRSGYCLLTREYAHTHNKHLGDVLRIRYGDRRTTLEVAGVIASPAIDIAVSFFQRGGEFQWLAVGSIFADRDDVARRLGMDTANMFMVNLTADPPPGFFPSLPPEPRAAKWRRHGEDFVLNEMLERLDRPRHEKGSARQFKQSIEEGLRPMVHMATAIPAVALVIAALGVANLMLANVTHRQRQLALMRAVGTTRWQVLRLVIGEALVLGMLGSGLGILLGMQLAYSSNVLTLRFSGFQAGWAIPWVWVGYGVALTVGLCLIAGLMPALRAARGNVVEALHTA